MAVILNIIKSEVRTGLKEDLKSSLFTKYEPDEELAFLKPPKINKKILSTLSATVIARDKHQAKTQAQVGASLNATSNVGRRENSHE